MDSSNSSQDLEFSQIPHGPLLDRLPTVEERLVWQELAGSRGWALFRSLLRDRLALNIDRLLTADDPKMLYRQQGRVAELQEILDLPKSLFTKSGAK